MSQFYFRTEQYLPAGIGKAWKFFSSAKNLARITPPELDFRIISAPGDQEIHEGMIIDYLVKPLAGWPVRWRTEIEKVQKPVLFIDRQVAGPYRTWVHRHEFIQKQHGLLMKDEVLYELPFGWIGDLVHRLLVRKRIEGIFEYRRQMLEKIFLKNEYCHG